MRYCIAHTVNGLALISVLEQMQEKKTRRQIFGITTYFDVGSTYF